MRPYRNDGSSGDALPFIWVLHWVIHKITPTEEKKRSSTAK